VLGGVSLDQVEVVVLVPPGIDLRLDLETGGRQRQGGGGALAAQRAVLRDRPPQSTLVQCSAGRLGLPSAEVRQVVVVPGPDRGLPVADQQHDGHQQPPWTGAPADRRPA
jgi:hypothetical protein